MMMVQYIFPLRANLNSETKFSLLTKQKMKFLQIIILMDMTEL